VTTATWDYLCVQLCLILYAPALTFHPSSLFSTGLSGTRLLTPILFESVLSKIPNPHNSQILPRNLSMRGSFAIPSFRLNENVLPHHLFWTLIAEHELPVLTPLLPYPCPSVCCMVHGKWFSRTSLLAPGWRPSSFFSCARLSGAPRLFPPWLSVLPLPRGWLFACDPRFGWLPPYPVFSFA